MSQILCFLKIRVIRYLGTDYHVSLPRLIDLQKNVFGGFFMAYLKNLTPYFTGVFSVPSLVPLNRSQRLDRYPAFGQDNIARGRGSALRLRE